MSALCNIPAFCVSYCACKALTSPCTLPESISRFVYLSFLFISTLLAFILQNFGQPIIIHYYNTDFLLYVMKLAKEIKLYIE